MIQFLPEFSMTHISQKSVFVSFREEDKTFFNILQGTIRDKQSPVVLTHYPTRETSEDGWKSEVRQILEQAYAMIVIIGKRTVASKAIEWEIKEAIRQGKKVFGLKNSSIVELDIPIMLKNSKNITIVDKLELIITKLGSD